MKNFSLKPLLLASVMLAGPGLTAAVSAQPAVEPDSPPKNQPQTAPDSGRITFLDGELTGTATLTSDYVFRGFSQHDEKISPLLSGSWMHKSGVHVDLFAAPVDFNQNDSTRLEVDTGIGYTHTFTDALAGDVSVMGYLYPGSDDDRDYDFVEGIGNLNYTFHSLNDAKATGLVAYSPEYYGHVGQSVFSEASLEVPAPVVKGVSVVGAYGRQMMEEAEDYNTWRAGVSYVLQGYTFGVTYHDTNVGDDACDKLCGARVVLSASKSF